MKNLEGKIEAKLKAEVEKLGGKCLKFVTPGTDGAPDRIILLRNTVHFVETKSPAGILSDVQRSYHKMLRRLGFTVFVIRDDMQLKNYINVIQRTPIPDARG